ncbi:CG7211 [Drosophila busckii]|uniref:ATP synthase subunit g n=1 Tax=Drosophila busckii TaxID=30019 RepID=A0A0M4ESM1_DROBS|nr:ATP synthase subunit g, mitochondrial [Drosophila busckii]ALC40107.1 CG7211 [Drosophila busckii]
MTNLAAKATALINKIKAQARPQLDEFWKYAKVELSPPLPADFGNIRKTAEEVSKQAKAKAKGSGGITVRDAWLNMLVTIEVITWFFMGEVIGRRHLVGYKV